MYDEGDEGAAIGTRLVLTGFEDEESASYCVDDDTLFLCLLIPGEVGPFVAARFE